jgi:uncharacterized protein
MHAAAPCHAISPRKLRPVYADDLLNPWSEQTMGLLPPVALFDAHTHIGVNDPDGFKCTAQELLDTLAPTGSRAVVFPMHEPDGYPVANDHVLEAAAGSDGRLVAFCRVDPRADPVTEIRRCVAAGARGIKLHPRAELFDLDEPAVREIIAVAEEEHLPILIHAGRGIPALGAHVLDFAREFPNARFILAHCAVCDLAWIWQRIHEYPNVFFDTAWFSAADQLAVYSHIPPGQILFATDIPFARASAERRLRAARADRRARGDARLRAGGGRWADPPRPAAGARRVLPRGGVRRGDQRRRRRGDDRPRAPRDARR